MLFARFAVLAVFLSNLSAAIPFLVRPASFAPAFELEGAVGAVMVRAIGLLFLMWVVPYVPVIVAPRRCRLCLGVIVAQQVIGLAGESWLWLTTPAGHRALRAMGRRFILFDTVGLLVLLLAACQLFVHSDRRGA